MPHSQTESKHRDTNEDGTKGIETYEVTAEDLSEIVV